MAITRVMHLVNGKRYGMFYHFDDGRCLYLAWRSGEKNRSLFFRENAWCIDITTLREARHRGCTAIGIAHKVGKSVNYYITNIDNFFNPPSEAHPEGKTPQRRLRRDHFIVNTTLSAGHIASALKIK